MTNDLKGESFSLDNLHTNHEEEEDEEEHLRRQEEIKNLLNVAMGDFNYDESTLNSLNGSIDVGEPHKHVQERYKTADYSDTLQALYEVRTKELEKLSHKVEELEREKSKILKEKDRQIICLQAEVMQYKLSLKECENLNALKVEEVNNLLEEKQTLTKSFKELQEKYEELNEERVALHEANNNLHQQLIFLEKGFLPMQTAEKAQEEKLKTKIEELTEQVQNLEKTIKKQDKEFINQKHLLEKTVWEKDELCKEKEEEIKKLSLELHEIRMESINFKSEIQNLKRENDDLKINLQKFRQNDYYSLNLLEKLKRLEIENKETKKKIEEQSNQLLQYQKFNEEQIIVKQMYEKEVQTDEKIEIIDIGVQTNLEDYDNGMLLKMKELEKEIKFLRSKESQRKEQEMLLNNLQKVAQNFEKMIVEKQSKIYVSTSSNTEDDLIESIKLNYETQIVKLEIQLREKIQQEFFKKLQQKEKHLELQLKETEKAEKQTREISQKMKAERKATIELLEELRKRFVLLEEEYIKYKNLYLEVVKVNNNLKEMFIKLNKEFKINIERLHKNFSFLLVKVVSEKEEKLKLKFTGIINYMQKVNDQIEKLQENSN